MMIGYDIYDRFTMEHFPLHQSMILTTSFCFFLLATVSILDRGMQIKINLKNVFYTLHLFQVVP
jgi:hypothetical protein